MRSLIFFLLLTQSWLTAMYIPINEEISVSIARYRASHESEHDMAALQNLALSVLKKGMRNNDQDIVQLSIFGCGAALHEEANQLLQQTLLSPSPMHQLSALTLLARQLDDSTADACLHGMGSFFLPIRIEALHLLCQMRYPGTVEQIDTLMAKVNEQIHPLFVQLYAQLGDHKSISRIKKNFHSNHLDIRLAAILFSAVYGHDQLLPEIRSLATRPHPLQQEACAWALGELYDGASKARLRELSTSSIANTRTAALTSLYRLGDSAAADELAASAKEGNLFAITALSDVVDSAPILAELVAHSDIQIATNAAVALAHQGDPRCLPIMRSLLIADERDLVLAPITSASGALNAWQVVPSARYNMTKNPMEYEIAVRSQNQLLNQLGQVLPESTFLSLVEEVLEKGKGHLIPTAVNALETLQTTASIALLTRYQHKLGDPLTRHYCELALFRLEKEGNHKEKLVRWLLKESRNAIIALRPPIPWERHRTTSVQEIFPSERSALLIEILQTLAENKDEGIETLLQAMEQGEPTNAYALAGLLMRAAS